MPFLIHTKTGPSTRGDSFAITFVFRCNHLKEAALTTIRRFPEKIVKTAGWTKLVMFAVTVNTIL